MRVAGNIHCDVPICAISEATSNQTQTETTMNHFARQREEANRAHVKKIASEIHANTFTYQQRKLANVFARYVSYDHRDNFGPSQAGIEAMLHRARGRIDGWFNNDVVNFIIPSNIGLNGRSHRFFIRASDFEAENLTQAKREQDKAPGRAHSPGQGHGFTIGQ